MDSSVGDKAMFRAESPEGRAVLGHGPSEAGLSHAGIARGFSQLAACSLEASVQDAEPDQFKENLERMGVDVCPQQHGYPAPLSTRRRQAACVESAVLSRWDRGLSQRLLADVFGLSRAGMGAVLHRVAKILVSPGSLDQIDAEPQQRKKAPVAEIWFDPPAITGARITLGASADPADSHVIMHPQSSADIEIFAITLTCKSRSV